MYTLFSANVHYSVALGSTILNNRHTVQTIKNEFPFQWHTIHTNTLLMESSPAVPKTLWWPWWMEDWHPSPTVGPANPILYPEFLCTMDEIRILHSSIKRISHLMWLTAKARPVIICPTLSFSLNLWDRLSATYKFRSLHSPLAPLLHNPAFTPGPSPHDFAWCTNKGLLRIADLYDGRSVLSKQQEKYPLPHTEFYRHTQIAHFKATQKSYSISSSMSVEYLCKNLSISSQATFPKYIIYLGL